MEITYEELETMLKDRYYFALQETRAVAIHLLEKWCEEQGLDDKEPKQQFYEAMRWELNGTQAK